MFARLLQRLAGGALVDHASGFADLLLWGHLVAPGVVLQKNGTLLGTWGYRGPDLDSSTPSQLALLSDTFNRALLPFGKNWLLHVDAIRKPASGYPSPSFPDPVTHLIDEERRLFYESQLNYQTDYYLTLTWAPPSDRQRGALDIFVRGQRKEELTPLAAAIDEFQRRATDFESLLSSALKLWRLRGDDLLSYLHTTLTSLHHPVRLPSTPIDLDLLLSTATYYGGIAPRIGDQHLRIVRIGGLPFASEPALLDHLNRLPFPFRWSSRFLPIEPLLAQTIIKRLRRSWYQGRQGLSQVIDHQLAKDGNANPGAAKGFTDRYSENMAQEADEALALAAGDTVRYGYYTAVVVVSSSDPDRADQDAAALTKEIRELGFSASDVETFNALAAFLGSLPGQGSMNVRRGLIHTRNLADLAPLTSVWSGHATAPHPALAGQPAVFYARTTASTPFFFNLHSGDVGHTLLVGPTGAGKSTFLSLLQAQWMRYPGAQVFVFDRGYSAETLAHAAGAAHYDLAGEHGGHLSFAPLSRIANPQDRIWLADWLTFVLELNGAPLTTQQQQRLDTALANIITVETRKGSTPTLKHLHYFLQDQDLRLRIGSYLLTEGGSYAGFLDSSVDHFGGGNWHTFEMGNLLELGDKLVLPVLTYLFYRLRARLRGQPTLIILDEAWSYLKNPLFAARIEQWLRELRKLNTSIVFASQSLADVSESPIRSAILESTPTKIFLPNAEASTPQGASFYRSIGLNDRQTELIAGAVPKREYYVTTPDGSRLIDLSLGPTALAWFVSSREQLHAVRSLRDRPNPADPWQQSWLRQRGLHQAANKLAIHLQSLEEAYS